MIFGVLVNINGVNTFTVYQSVSQSNQIYIAPYVAIESEARVGGAIGGVFTFTVSNVKQFCL